MMLKTNFVVGTCVLFLLLGTQHRQLLRAAKGVPNACPQYQCKQISYIWYAKNAGFATGYFKATTKGGALSNHAALSIFTISSTFQLPIALDLFTLNDWYTYAACIPTCGTDANGVWQANQEVAPVGEKMLDEGNNFRHTCTPTNGGVDGPKTNPVVNRNGTGKKVPPG